MVAGLHTLTWCNDDGHCTVLDLAQQTASMAASLPVIAGGSGETPLPVEGLEIRAGEVVCMRLTDSGDLVYLAVGVLTSALLELFKRVPGADMSTRGARAWRRALRSDARVFMSVLGDVGVVDFVDTVRFPLELVIEPIHRAD